MIKESGKSDSLLLTTRKHCLPIWARFPTPLTLKNLV